MSGLDETSALERYGHNLTVLARQGAFPPLAGQEAIIERIFEILQRKNKANPILLDFDQSRRFSIVAEVVRCMAIGEAPAPFVNMQVIALDVEALFSNLSDDSEQRQQRIEQYYASLWKKLAKPVSNEPEADEAWWARMENFPLWPQPEEWIAPSMVLERLQHVFLAMYHAPGAYLMFIDHFHRLLGGEPKEYLIDASNLLKPMLARRQIQLITACTVEQYRLHIEQNAAMYRRFQEIVPPEVRQQLEQESQQRPAELPPQEEA